jgi:hypothetical protein
VVVTLGHSRWEECRLKVFENRVLRRTFGPTRDEVTGEWRRLHKKELYALYSSPNFIWVIKSRRLGRVEHVARMADSNRAYSVIAGKPEERRPLGRPWRRWEHNIKINLKEVEWGTLTRSIFFRIGRGGGLL